VQQRRLGLGHLIGRVQRRQLGHARQDTTSIDAKLANAERRAIADWVQW
jgi:hypothetical protein